MSIGSKMRSLGESTYFLKATYEPLKEIMGDKKYEMKKDPIKGIIVHTDRIEGELLENVNDFLNNEFGSNFRKTRYNHHIEVSWRDINKYAECTIARQMYDLYPDEFGVEVNFGCWNCFPINLTTDGEFPYPLPKMQNFQQNWGNGFFKMVYTKHFKIDLPSLVYGHMAFNNCKSETIEVHAPKWKDLRTAFANCSNVRSIKVDTTVAELGGELCQNSSLLEDFTCDLSKIIDLSHAFHKCILNKASALRILNGIPAYTSGSHKLVIGIHIDHQTDDEVLAAITNAESKGWTLTVQWNGTPTAQVAVTYRLRKPPIYVRMSEIEYPDGSKDQMLDWGHYVSNPEDYEEFSSLEEAYEHFGLPNDLEKLNNSEQ